MLLCGALSAVVRNVDFHKLVEPSESVTETCVFDSLLIRDDVVIEGPQLRDRVDQEVPVAGDLAHWVVKQCHLHDLGKGGQCLQVLPLRQVVVVQVKKLQTLETLKDLGRWERLKLIVTQVNFFQSTEGVQKL